MRYFESIDLLTLWRWRKALGGEVKYCRVDTEVGTKEEDAVAWERLRDEHIKAFGLGKEYLRIIELQLEIAEMQCELAISGTLFLQNAINLLQQELKELLERQPEGSIDECLIALSIWLKFHFDEKERTVKEFKNYMEAYKKECDRIKALNQKAS